MLVWGANTVLNFQSGRDSPTQFHYGYPLIVPDAITSDYIREMVRDLQLGQPAIIVDSTMVDGDRVPPLDPTRRITWWEAGGRRDVANLEPIYSFVAEHCWIANEIDGIVIYRCEYPNTRRLPLSPVTGPPVRALFDALNPVLVDSYTYIDSEFRQAFPDDEPVLALP